MKRALPLLALAGISFAVPLRAGAIRATGNTVAVRAQGVPLGELLRELGTYTPLDVVAVDAELPGRRVDISLDGVPLDQAAGAIMLEAGCSFVVGGLKGQPLRVILGSSDPAHLTSAVGPSAPSGTGALGAAGELPTSPEEVRALREQWQSEQAAQAEAREAELKAVSDMEREAEQIPIEVWDDQHVPGGYTMVGESTTYHDPGFVPYKNRPEVRARRLAVDPSTIP